MVSYKALNTIGKHLASQQDGIVGYGYAVKAVARTESGFTYTFECGGQGEFLQVVAIYFNIFKITYTNSFLVLISTIH